MINCVIIDNEPLARQILKSHVFNTPELNLVSDCGNAIDAFGVINSENIELLFLDIQMPSLTGIDFISSLRNPPAVIFTTAFSEYAVKSYELNAVDYLLKPITYERFCLSIAKYLNIQTKNELFKPYFYFKVNGKMVKIETNDITYAKSVKDYVIVNTLKGNFITHMTMKYLVELLPKILFKQIHRSFIVGVSHITSIERNNVQIGVEKIPIGEKYKGVVDLIIF